jgi:L-amino acid N-acyltransferase YncA
VGSALRLYGMRNNLGNPQLSSVSVCDVLYLRKVRNGDAVRKESDDLRKIGLIEHLLWYARNARWIHLHSYIVFVGARRAGYVRLGHVSAAEAEISIAIEPWAQGRGLGLESLRRAVGRYSKIGDLKKLTAQVHRENSRSLAVFTRAGFVIEEEPGPRGTLLLTKSLAAEAGKLRE